MSYYLVCCTSILGSQCLRILGCRCNINSRRKEKEDEDDEKNKSHRKSTKDRILYHILSNRRLYLYNIIPILIIISPIVIILLRKQQSAASLRKQQAKLSSITNRYLKLSKPPTSPQEIKLTQDPIIIATMTSHFFGSKYESVVPNCPYTCTFVKGRNSSPKENKPWKEIADALWYHAPSTQVKSEIKKYHSNQLSVIMSLESARYYKRLHNPHYMKKFDLEMTYRTSSDIPLYYFGMYAHDLKILEPPSTPANNKTQAVIYLQSNCEARSNRHSIVKAMVEASIVPIHAAGACAKQLGKVNEPSKILTTGRLPDKNIIGTYAFCIAMENSIDEDYVTEKIWDALNSGCVPIYYGSPTIRSILPDPNAVILYDDFLKEDNPVAAMTNELKRLLDDPKAYEEKLAWKGKPLEELSEGFQEYVMRVKMISDGRCVLCTQALEERLRVYRLERLRTEARKR